MPKAALTSPSRSHSFPQVVVGLILAAAIAWLQPFDRVFAVLTFGQPVIRAALIVVLALVGARAGGALGLKVAPGRAVDGLALALLVGVSVGLLCAACDLIFRTTLDPGYVRGVVDTGLGARVAVFMAHAFNEEVLYRLFLGSVLAWAFARRTAGATRTRAIWCAFGLAQAVNVGVNVLSRAIPGPVGLAYDALRFFAPGLVWSWLYLHRGFCTAVAGHMAAHVVFQPLVGLILSGAAAT